MFSNVLTLISVVALLCSTSPKTSIFVRSAAPLPPTPRHQSELSLGTSATTGTQRDSVFLYMTFFTQSDILKVDTCLVHDKIPFLLKAE